jgi:hypothetical protein
MHNANRKAAYHNAFTSLLGGLMGTDGDAAAAHATEQSTFDSLVKTLLMTNEDTSTSIDKITDKAAFESILDTLLM